MPSSTLVFSPSPRVSSQDIEKKVCLKRRLYKGGVAEMRDLENLFRAMKVFENFDAVSLSSAQRAVTAVKRVLRDWDPSLASDDFVPFAASDFLFTAFDPLVTGVVVADGTQFSSPFPSSQVVIRTRLLKVLVVHAQRGISYCALHLRSEMFVSPPVLPRPDPRDTVHDVHDVIRLASFSSSSFFLPSSSPSPLSSLPPLPPAPPASIDQNLIAAAARAVSADCDEEKKKKEEMVAGSLSKKQRVCVYWEGDSCHYAGTRKGDAKPNDETGEMEVFVQYEDGDEQWEVESSVLPCCEKTLTCPRPKGHVGRCKRKVAA